MNEAAIRLIKEAVIRALVKNPSDIDFYRAQAKDPSRQTEYRQALREAIEECEQMGKLRKPPAK